MSVLGSGTTAGCLSGDDNDDTARQPADSVEVWGWDVAADALQITASEYESAHDSTVTVTEFERPALKSEFQEALEAGEAAPEVAMLETIDAPETIDSSGGLRDLSDWIEDAGLRSAFIESAWASVDIDGGTYAMPWDIGPVVVYYRRSIYEEYGIEPTDIETWSDFVSAGKNLPDDIALLNLPPGDLNGQWRTLCRQQGMQPITEDGKINIASEKSRRSAAVLNDLHQAGLTTRYTGFTEQWAQAYEDDEIASLLSASWMVGTMQTEMPSTAGDWGVFRIPAFDPGGRRASNWGGSNLLIPEQIDEETARRAWEYITWSVARKDMQVLMFQRFGLFPTLEAAYEDPIFDEEVAFFDGQQVRQIFIEVAEEIPRWRFTTATPTISNAIDAELKRMLDGKQTPQQATETAAETVANETGREVVSE